MIDCYSVDRGVKHRRYPTGENGKYFPNSLRDSGKWNKTFTTVTYSISEEYFQFVTSLVTKLKEAEPSSEELVETAISRVVNEKSPNKKSGNKYNNRSSN